MGAPSALSLAAIAPELITQAAFHRSGSSAAIDGVETARPAAALPQSGVGSLFTVTGKIKVLDIVGTVVTGIQNQANNTKLQAKASGQTAVDMCATADVANKAANIMFSITGVAATALQSGFAVLGMSQPWIVQDGTIDLSCSASNTGTVKWTLRWIPLEAGATVVAA